ncbi:MAG: hypothetical protein ACOCSK_00315 [Rhodothermales bacterium]
MTTSDEFQFTAMEAERLREQVSQLKLENKRLRELLASLHVKIALPLADEVADRKAMMAEIDAALEGDDMTLSKRLAILDGRSNSNEASITGDEYVAIAREAVAALGERDGLLDRAARMLRAVRYRIQLADGEPLDQWLADYEAMTKETPNQTTLDAIAAAKTENGTETVTNLDDLAGETTSGIATVDRGESIPEEGEQA